MNLHGNSLSGLRTTVVYKTFWEFAAERQLIFAKRLRGDPEPWSNDHVFQRYRFTNAYRAADRVSQFLIRKVIYEGDSSPTETLFRILVFRFFNRIETWELLTGSGIEIRWEAFQWRRASRILKNEMNEHRPIYSAAYIIPPGPVLNERRLKHESHFVIIKGMMKDDLALRLQDARSMQEAYSMLRKYPLMGPFLAYQLVTDINYSGITSFDEMQFTVAGPGARSGIAKCFSESNGLREEEIIKFVTDRQEEEFTSRGLKFLTLWGRLLQLIDVQNLFCEIDKYARVRHAAIEGIGARHRIKRLFKPASGRIDLWFPPKWNLNQRIKQEPLL